MLIFLHKYRKIKQEVDVVKPTVESIINFVQKLEIHDRKTMATILMKCACEFTRYVSRYVAKNPHLYEYYHNYVNEIYEIYNDNERKTKHGSN